MNQSDLDDMLTHPSESLAFEIKTWIDPRTQMGVAKIAKACLALRNRGGGYLLIGFNDRTLSPDPYQFDKACKTIFHQDCIQEIISRYANDIFEVITRFGVQDTQDYPIIEIPPGVTVPVVVKRDFVGEGGQSLMAVGDIYFRSLSSNGRPSSVKALPADWKTIMDICFENRESDIERFLRRHLGVNNKSAFFEAVQALQAPALQERAVAMLTSGDDMAAEAFAKRQPDNRPPGGLGSWSAALVIDPGRPNALPSQEFLQRVAAANPQYTGWPVWLDSRGFTDAASRPKVRNGGWEATISSGRGWSQHYDFMRFDPTGRFYLWRTLQDDLTDKVAPLTALDPFIMMLRVTEVIAVGLQIARQYEPSAVSSLGIAFEWVGLNGRNLESWANPLYPSSLERV